MNLSKSITLFLSVSIFILLPFVFSSDLQDAEQSPRFLALSVIITISSILTLFLAYQNKVSIKKDKLFIVVLLFLLLQILAFSRAINWGDALFELLKSLLFFSLFFQFILLFSADEKNKFIFLKTFPLTALIFVGIALYLLIPSFETYLQTGKSIDINWKVASSLGNKNFFAETIFLLLPFILLLAFGHFSKLTNLPLPGRGIKAVEDRKVSFDRAPFVTNGVWRIICAGVAILNILVIIILQTLSTWFALVAAFSVVLLIVIVLRKQIFINLKSLRSFYLGVTAIIVCAFVGAFVIVQAIGTNSIKKRIHTFQNLLDPYSVETLELYQNSTYERIILWKNSLSIISDYPLIGAGMANWKIINPTYGMGSAKHMTKGKIRFIHPHNDLLLVASETGLIGLALFLSFLSLLFYYTYSLLKNSLDPKSNAFAISAIFLLTGFIIIAIFSMPMIRIFPPIILMLTGALIVSKYLQKREQTSTYSKNLILTVLSISVSVSIVASVLGYIRLTSDLKLTAALREEKNNNFQGMKMYLGKIDKDIFSMDATITPIAWFEGFASFYQGDHDGAFKFFKEAEKVNPNHVMVLNDLGTCYNLNGDIKTAVQYYQKALKLQPSFDDAILNLSIMYFNTGNIDAAFSTLYLYDGGIKMESINVFQTIIVAKAQLFTSNEMIINNLHKRLRRPVPAMALLKELREKKGDLMLVLEIHP